MIIELKPEFQRILEQAEQSGVSREDVLSQVFALVQGQIDSQQWLSSEKQAVEEHIAEGCAQADSGDLIDPEDAMRMLKERRTKRNVA